MQRYERENRQIRQEIKAIDRKYRSVVYTLNVARMSLKVAFTRVLRRAMAISGMGRGAAG